MATTNKLRDYVKALLAPMIPGGVYWQNASDRATCPYAVFDLQELIYSEGFSLQSLEVNLMDYGEDTARAEDLADLLQSSLDHHQATTEDFELSIYRDRRQSVPENDKKIIRRRLTFEVRLYERR